MTVAPTEQRTLTRDAISPWYIVWVIVWFLFIEVINYLDYRSNLYFAVIPLVGLPSIALLLSLLISLIVNLITRRVRRLLSIVAAIILVLILVVLMRSLAGIPQFIRMELFRSVLLKEVNAIPAENGPRLKCWEWGSTGGGAVANIFWTLVYDESDQINLPRQLWRAQWNRKVEEVAKEKDASVLNLLIHPERIAPNEHLNVERLQGHFYLITDIYQ